jgi:phosphatidylglycerophosphate synthase
MLRKAIYPKIESYLNQAAKFCQQQGFTPNQLTLAGLAFSFLSGWIYASGHFFLGALVLILGSFGDMLDGPLARLTNRSSKFGAFLDSTVDRYSDFFLFGGVALFYARNDQVGTFLIVMGIIMGAYVTSYTKARAENFIESCSVGTFERPERLIVLAFGSILYPLMPVALWILLIGTNATAIQRILFTKKQLPEPPPAS